MRLVHFADTHLGFTESSRVDAATGINVRERDVYAAFDAIIDRTLALKPDVVVHAGDLFHSPRPSNRAITTALLGLQRLSAAGIPSVLVAGNHSVPRAAASGSIFEALGVLPGVHAAYVGRYEVFTVGAAAIHCVPHVHDEAALEAALAEVQPRADRQFNVLVLHGAVRGTGEGASLGEFNEVAIGRAALARFAGFDYVALGHYHAHLKLGPNARYSGSSERLHQNEAGYEKGFLEIDLATRRVTFHALAPRPIVLLDPIPCAGRPAPAIVAAVASGLREAAAPGAILVVRLREVDPVTWVEVMRARRALEREHAAAAFEVRWDRTLAVPAHRGREGAAPIGSLATEFASFLKTCRVEGLARRRLRLLGERLLSEAQEGEARE